MTQSRQHVTWPKPGNVKDKSTTGLGASNKALLDFPDYLVMGNWTIYCTAEVCALQLCSVRRLSPMQSPLICAIPT